MFDLSVEHYFADVGSCRRGMFYKKFQNYIQYGSSFVDFTNNGVTKTIEIRGPENGKGGKVYGVEGGIPALLRLPARRAERSRHPAQRHLCA